MQCEGQRTIEMYNSSSIATVTLFGKERFGIVIHSAKYSRLGSKILSFKLFSNSFV